MTAQTQIKADEPVFNLTETQKAMQLNVSASFLQKDRLRDEPRIPFKRLGRMIRYAVDLP